MEAMERALEIANQRGDVDCRVRCLRLMGVHLLFCGENDAATRTIQQLGAVASAEMPSAVPEAEAALGFADLFTGQLQGLRVRLERRRAIDLRDINDAQRQRHHVRYLSDRIVNVGNVLSHLLWMTGSPDAALRMSEETVRYAQDTEHHLSLGNALSWAIPLLYWTGHHGACARHVAQLDALASRHGFEVRRPTALFYRAALAGEQHDASPAVIDDLRDAVMAFHATGNFARLPYYLGILAEVSVRWGRLDEAEATIAAALDRAVAKNEQWCMPELLRIQASVLAAGGHTAQAESQLRAATSLARDKGTTAWQLRAATDLARLLSRHAREDEARGLLLPMVDAFTQGRGTRDVVEATRLLAHLDPLGRLGPLGRLAGREAVASP